VISKRILSILLCARCVFLCGHRGKIKISSFTTEGAEGYHLASRGSTRVSKGLLIEPHSKYLNIFVNRSERVSQSLIRWNLKK